MVNNAINFLVANRLTNLSRISDYSMFKGKYVFMLHDYNPNIENGPIVVKRMGDFCRLIGAGARVVDGLFCVSSKSIEHGFKARCGEPYKLNENYVQYKIKTLVNTNWIDTPHGFVKNPYDKTFMKHMQDGESATLENIIIDEIVDTKFTWEGWNPEAFRAWVVNSEKNKKLLAGFDAFIWAKSSFHDERDKYVALKLLRYACKEMPLCFLDSDFEHFYEQNRKTIPYSASVVKIWEGTEITYQR